MFSSCSTGQRGNIMVYLLIAIALFGALTLILSRQNAQSDAQSTNDEQLTLNANDVIDYANGVQSVIDQMIISGTDLDELSFVNPTSAGFDTGSSIHKVFHARGGGLSRAPANPRLFTGDDDDPDPGWYLGRFNNVEWTPSSARDVILTAHQISQPICAGINKRLHGDAAIPALDGTGNIADYLIDDAEHTGTNAALTEIVCGDCKEKPALCVSNNAGTMWSFYSIIGVQ